MKGHLPEKADASARRGRKDRRPGRRWRPRPLCASGGRRSGHAWLKHSTRRLFRRWAKHDPEGAPRKNRYRGYET